MGEPRPPAPRLPQTVADILESMTDAFVALDRDWNYLYVNRRAGEMFRRAPEDLVGKHIWTEFPEGVGQPFHRMYEQAMREQRFLVLEDYYEPFGRWFENRIYPSPEGLTIFFQDITERKVAAQELSRREQLYRTLAHAFSSVVWEGDAQGRPLPSDSWSDLTGRGDGDPDPGWIEAVHPDDREHVSVAWAAAIGGASTFDCPYRIRSSTGEWRHVRARGVPVLEDGAVVQWIGVIDDITEQVRAEEALRRAALEDPLTGLPNRALFLDRVQSALAHRDHGPVAVMYVDVDRFKAVNDTLGHAGGDDLLRAVAERLRSGVRPSDVVSRLSGDEFAVLCDDLHSEDEGWDIAQRLAAALAAPPSDGASAISASIGVAFAGADERDAEALLRDADAAMYEAKAVGGGAVEVFGRDLRERLSRRRSIERELRAGLESGEGLDLHFQPAVSFNPGWPSVAEALLRWRARDGTTLPALDAVSVAEQAGMIVPIGAAVLQRACLRAAEWNAQEGEPVGVAVNVSAEQLARPAELIAQVTGALETSALSPDLLWLEITESMLIASQERTEKLLTTLRELGVHVALDDFGVGYSSLSYLHRLPVDAVKVDRSFVAGLPDDRGSARIIDAVVGIGRAFKTGVVAEGVETREQLQVIRALGCTGVQGYGLARPVPAGELPAALAEAVRRASA